MTTSLAQPAAQPVYGRGGLCLGEGQDLSLARCHAVSSLHQGFQETGQSVDAEATFRWLDRADGHPLVQQIKQRMLDVCAVGEGDQVLDVGCGLGHEVRRLVQRVGPRGRVVGIGPHVICLSGTAGFANYQQLNQGTIDRAMQAGQVTASDAAAWWTALERAAQAETFFTANLGFIAAGYKP